MPFGLCNAGATFQRLVDIVLSGLTYEICLAYIDDIVLFSRTIDEHFDRLRSVLERLRTAGLKLKPSKCFFRKKSVGFLGHVISEQGIEAQPQKLQAVMQWPTPECVRDVRARFGLTGYYRKFVKDYASIAKPLTALSSPSVPCVWSNAAQQSFDRLKDSLTSPPILAMPTVGDTSTLDTDASDKAIGAVLSQSQTGVERVIAFASRSLWKQERNYNVRFRVRTDHAALV